MGWGGVSLVSRARGLSRPVISQGIKERREGTTVGEGRIRPPCLSDDLERLVEPVTRGDRASPLRWTRKSVRTLAQERQGRGHQVSHAVVRALAHTRGRRAP